MDFDLELNSVTTEFLVLDAEVSNAEGDFVVLSMAKDFPGFKPFTVSIPISKEKLLLMGNDIIKDVEDTMRKEVSNQLQESDIIRN